MDFDNLFESDNFYEWFWNNITTLIPNLNTFNVNRNGPGANRIRHEQYSPTINSVSLAFVPLSESNQGAEWSNVEKVNNAARFMMNNQLLLMYVGSTNNHRVPGERTKTALSVKNANRGEGRFLGIPFCLPVDFTNSTRTIYVEDQIRNAVGISIDEAFIRALHLTPPTKWFITSQVWLNAVDDILEKNMPGETEDAQVTSMTAVLTELESEAYHRNLIGILAAGARSPLCPLEFVLSCVRLK